MNVRYLNAVARDVKNGKIALPELDLATDSDYTYVWALVDSGAGANVAKKNAFPLSEPVDAPEISLTTAKEEQLPHSGAHRVTAYARDGRSTERTFYAANVELPVLAISELSREGRDGSEVRLRQKAGIFRDLATGKTQPIIKRRGVYCMKMFVRKNNVGTDGTSGFARPVQR